MKRFFLTIIILSISPSPSFADRIPRAPSRPEVFINGQSADVTIQDLSGLATKPMRLLREQNNRAYADEIIQVYAVGAKTKDVIRLKWKSTIPKTRVTLYRVFHGLEKKNRFFDMPITEYYDDAGDGEYEEIITPFQEEFFLLIFERVLNSNDITPNVEYFKKMGTRVSIASYKTNLLFSSLKFKMGDSTGKVIERDAQYLIDRFNRLERVFLLRVWKAD